MDILSSLIIEWPTTKTGLTDELSVLKSTALLGINAEKAFENMQFTITKFPNSAAAYNMRGLFFYGINDMANSLKDFNKAYELCTTDDSLKFEILINRSGVSHHVNKIENAIADCSFSRTTCTVKKRLEQGLFSPTAFAETARFPARTC